MPAIGSYRGCDSCRKWKKKCDSSQPGQQCSRCRTRNIPCVGVGQQRFKFKVQSSSSSTSGRSSHRIQQDVSTLFVGSHSSPPPLGSPKRPLGNPNNRIAEKLVYLLESTHTGHSLQAFRPYLFDNLPRRLGYSAALDAALAAFTSLLETQQSSYEQLNPRSLQLYVSGLKVLQRSLANPTSRGEPNTLCAAHIISECYVWIAQDNSNARRHSEGLSSLMGSLVHEKPKDSFLRSVCFAITSNLLQDSIFNSNIQLNPWIQNLYDVHEPLPPSDDIQTTSHLPRFSAPLLAMIPDLIRHPKENEARIQWVYNSILDRHLQMKVYLSANQDKLSQNTYHGMLCNGQYGAYIAIGITLNAILRVLNPSNILLATEQSIFCGDAIILAERAKEERPLAAHHVPQAIVSAWCVTGDSKTRERLRQLIEDYRHTYAMAKLLQHISYWQVAPPRLMEIPWFRLHCTKQGSQGAGDETSMERRTERRTERTNKEVQEFCCIL